MKTFIDSLPIDSSLIEDVRASYFMIGREVNIFLEPKFVEFFKRTKTSFPLNEESFDYFREYIYFKFIHEEKESSTSSFIITSVHAKGRSKKEKDARRIGDFKKNIMPTLSRKDKAYFTKKYGPSKD
jgi:hypothetical protein